MINTLTTNCEAAWKWFWTMLAEYWPTVVMSALNLVSAFVSIQPMLAGHPLYFIALVLIGVVANIVLWHKQHVLLKKVKIYEDVFSAALSPEEALNILLGAWVKGIRFTHAERVSVYKHDAGKFYRIGRHCPDPNLSDGGSRTVYEGGVIFKTWEQEKLKIELLPDPNEGIDEYHAALLENDVAISKTKLKLVRLKARSYYAFRLPEPEGQHSMAVILFESKKPAGLDMKKLENLLTLPEAGIIARQVSQRELPTSAKMKGY